MTQPGKRLSPAASAAQRRPSSLKSIFGFIAVLLIYIWASQGLNLAPGEFAKAETWSAMNDLLVRMGPYERINTCKNAKIVWGEPDPVTEAPWSEKTDLKKVQAVCEQGKTLYWYRSDYLEEQVAYVKTIADPLGQTMRMALLGAFFGSLLALPFSLLSAANLVRSKVVYHTVRIILNLIRTIPDLVLAAVLAGAFGLGALPGVLALTVFSFAMVAKLLSESIEAIEPGPLEAIRASGGNWLQMVWYGVLPQVLPQYLAYALYIFEIDVRSSTVLGLVGAGGIGATLYADLNLLKFRNVGAIVVAILLIVVVMEFISAKVRERLV